MEDRSIDTSIADRRAVQETEISREEPKKGLSVGSKVYSLVGFCLLLLTAVGGFAQWQMQKIGEELVEIAERDVPLTGVLTKLTIHQLEQSIELERAIRFGHEQALDASYRVEYEKSKSRFAKFSKQISNEMKGLKKMAERFAVETTSNIAVKKFTSVADKMKKFQSAYIAYDMETRRVFDLVDAGKIKDAAKIEPKIGKMHRDIDHGLEEMLFDIEKFTENAAKTAEAHELFALFLLRILNAVALLIGAACAFFLVQRTVAKPLQSLVASLEALSRSDYDHKIEVRSNDEIGRVATALKLFKEKLIEGEKLKEEQFLAEKKAAEDEVRRKEQKREADARAEEERLKAEKKAEAERKKAMLDMADQFENTVKTVVDSLAVTTTQFQSSAKEISRTADLTSQQAVTVAAASEEASTNVQTVASAAEELSASVSEISRQVKQSNEIAQGAMEEAKLTNEKVEGLAEAAQKIGDVVSLINDIASQTNLLALNATIEAARAGESGKGFAVVASEVKSLASQTSKATEDIATHIADIQGATSEAVDAIQEIGATISQMGDIAQSVASAVEEQGAATHEIAGSVVQASAGTQEVSENISSVTKAASENQISSEEMLSAANHLAEKGDQLRNEVDGFLSSVRAA